MLEVFESYEVNIMLVTKSTLVLRDIPLLKNIKKVVVSITLTTLEGSLAKKLEPFCPTPGERLNAMEKLAKHFPVVCRLDPLMYPLNTKGLKKVLGAIRGAGAQQLITSTYKVRADNFKRMSKAFPEHTDLWQKLYHKQGEKINGYCYLPQEMRTELIEEVRSISAQQGLAFSSCREGLSKANTRRCDGSSWF
jgi:DNA repair photolyase